MLHHILQRCKAAIVIEAAFRVCPEARQRRGPVSMVRGTIGLERIDTDFFGRVEVPPRFRPQRLDMAGATLGLAAEERIATCGSRRIKTACRWARGGNGELIEMQGWEFGGDEIRLIAYMPKSLSRRDGKLSGIIEARVEKRTLAMHLQIRNKRIPMRH